MEAPSEKHLEDWLVKNYPFASEPFQIKRQVSLPSGRADLIVIEQRSISIVELKKGRIDSLALAQCLRYMGDIRSIMQYALADYWVNTPDVDHYMPQVDGVLIGTDVTDKHFWDIGNHIGVQFISYNYISELDTYDFGGVSVKPPKISEYYFHAITQLGKDIRGCFERNKAFHDNHAGWHQSIYTDLGAFCLESLQKWQSGETL